MDKRMHFSEKISMESNAANQESNEGMFVHRVASSGLVLKFKVDKYGTLPSKHSISSQEAMMSGGKQNVSKLLDNFEANCSPNAIPLLEQSEISAAEGTGSNKIISLFDDAKVAPQEEIGYTCDECPKWFKEIKSLHGHKGVHRREEKKLAAAWALYSLLMESKRHRSNEFSASMTCSNKYTSADEEVHEMREVADILVTLAQSFCKDSTVHVSSSASTAKCFVCTICEKNFSSYHGLGGHMSIHNKKPTKNNLLEDGGAGSSGGARQRGTWKPVCDSKCNAKFTSGQILGGEHKRKHWWEDYYYKALLEDRNVKPRLLMLPHHETERSGLVVVPTDENIQPAGTGMVVAAHMVPLACDAVQQPEQAMSLGTEIEMPMPSGVSDEDVV